MCWLSTRTLLGKKPFCADWTLHVRQWTVRMKWALMPADFCVKRHVSKPICAWLPSRMGWTPSHPAFDRNPLDIADDAAAAGMSVDDYVVDELRAGRLRFAGEDPDHPANFPRVMTVWRANLLGSSGKGMEYFMRHLLGVEDAVRAGESPEQLRPSEVVWHEGNYQSYKEDLKKRKGVDADQPHRVAYRKLVRA